MYGVWRSREHFSVPGSNPAATSVDVHVLADAARRDRGAGRGPAPVIAELVVRRLAVDVLRRTGPVAGDHPRAGPQVRGGARRLAALVFDHARRSSGGGDQYSDSRSRHSRIANPAGTMVIPTDDAPSLQPRTDPGLPRDPGALDGTTTHTVMKDIHGWVAH